MNTQQDALPQLRTRSSFAVVFFRVLFLGLPGICLMTYCVVGLVVLAMLNPHEFPWRPWVLASGGFVAGCLLLLAAWGKLREPLYILTFAPLPVILALAMHLDAAGSSWGWPAHLAIFLWPVGAYSWCKSHYRGRGGAH
jgi:hypothetical protein